MAIWYGNRLVAIQDVPATICDSCKEQSYDQETNQAIVALTERGFPRSEAWQEIVVPVFQLPSRANTAEVARPVAASTGSEETL
jgi:hypothetical protein